MLSFSLKWVLVSLTLIAASACSTPSAATAPAASAPPTRETRAQLAGAEVIDWLKEGNRRFTSGEFLRREWMAEARLTAEGQYPLAMIVSCMDSRVPVETIFDAGMGELFVARVAGNVINADILGSLEYAAVAVDTPVIVVLGHTHCGAVKGAVAGVELGNLTGLLAKIQPAIETVRAESLAFAAHDAEALRRVSEANVRLAVAHIGEQSDVLRQRIENGSLLVRGATYDLDSGLVHFLAD